MAAAWESGHRLQNRELQAWAVKALLYVEQSAIDNGRTQTGRAQLSDLPTEQRSFRPSAVCLSGESSMDLRKRLIHARSGLHRAEVEGSGFRQRNQGGGQRKGQAESFPPRRTRVREKARTAPTPLQRRSEGLARTLAELFFFSTGGWFPYRD